MFFLFRSKEVNGAYDVVALNTRIPDIVGVVGAEQAIDAMNLASVGYLQDNMNDEGAISQLYKEMSHFTDYKTLASDLKLNDEMLFVVSIDGMTSPCGKCNAERPVAYLNDTDMPICAQCAVEVGGLDAAMVEFSDMVNELIDCAAVFSNGVIEDEQLGFDVVLDESIFEGKVDIEETQ